MAKFLDQSGVEYLWGKIKSTFVAQVAGKGLSTEDFTTELKTKLDGLSNYVLPVASGSTLGGVKQGAGVAISGDGTLSTIIQSIKINGSVVSPVSGEVDLGSIATDAGLEALTERVNTIEGNVTDLTTNKVNKSDIAQNSGQSTDQIMSQKAVTDFVNSSINSNSAHYLTKDAEGNVFATHAELTGASAFYYGGEVHTPHDHDFAFVQSDEDNDNASVRYTYSGGQWVLQYIVNEAPLTAGQLQAINSGITAAKVSTYDGYAAQIAGKLDASALVQATGQSTSQVMSQKAVTDALNGKANSATTIAGYGITDAKIEGRVITLGSENITVPEEDTALTTGELDEILV